MSAPTEGVRFVDFSAAFDGGAIVGPSGEAIRSLDELHLCEPCLRAAGEALAFKPELHARQLNEIRRLEVQAEHWEAYAKRLEATLKDRPDAPPSARRGRR